jgi:hypothetical protein
VWDPKCLDFIFQYRNNDILDRNGARPEQSYGIPAESRKTAEMTVNAGIHARIAKAERAPFLKVDGYQAGKRQK